MKLFRTFKFLPFQIGLLLVLISSCQKKSEMLWEQNALDVENYLQNLAYDAGQLLNVQNIPQKLFVQTVDSSQSKPERIGGWVYVCSSSRHSLQENFDDVAILRASDGVIYPGALVYGDSSLMDGNPLPLPLKRAPVKLRVDLPGIGEAGIFTVSGPDAGNVQAALDKSLDSWNNGAYQEGYVNPAYVSYQTSSSYSSQQVSLALGLNVAWAGNEVASHFNQTSSSEKTVAMAVFKQGFYSVSAEVPASPASVFDRSVTLEEVKAKLDNNRPPAYVQNVIYGRIVMFRIEASSSISSSELDLALQYATGVTKVSGDAELKIKNVLKSSSIKLILIGGNAAVATESVSATNFADLQKILKGDQAVYSKSNPGVPIAYTVRYLRDNSIAKMGYTTDYTTTACGRTPVPGKVIRLNNKAGFDVRYYISYKNGNDEWKNYTSNKAMLGQERSNRLPDGAHEISIAVKYSNGSSYSTIKTYNYDIPEKVCFETSGTLFNPKVKRVTCN